MLCTVFCMVLAVVLVCSSVAVLSVAVLLVCACRSGRIEDVARGFVDGADAAWPVALQPAPVQRQPAGEGAL